MKSTNAGLWSGTFTVGPRAQNQHEIADRLIIAIIAAISLVSYNGIQGRARDTQRQQHIKTIAKALELYYIDNGKYPPGSCAGSCTIGAAWSTTNDGSWANLTSYLVPKYISTMPSEPNPTIATSPLSSNGYGYGYYSNDGTYCGSSLRQMYILVYRLEGSPQQNSLFGSCSTNPFGPFSSSNYRVVIGT